MKIPEFKWMVISLTLLGVGFLGGYLLTQNTSNVTEKVEKIESQQELPKCLAGICPSYSSMDVDGDGLAESIVIIPTAMTQGAGKVWVIKDDKVIFDSGEKMRIYAFQTKKQVEDGNGFILQYGTEINSTNGVEIKYIYKDGQFTPEEN